MKVELTSTSLLLSGNRPVLTIHLDFFWQQEIDSSDQLEIIAEFVRQAPEVLCRIRREKGLNPPKPDPPAQT